MTSSKISLSTRSTLPFAKKMRIIAIGGLVCGGLIGGPIVWSAAVKPLSPFLFATTRAIEIIVWLYLSGILLQFYRGTQLREYILQIHTYWLAGIIAFPITYLFGAILLQFRAVMPQNLYTFLGFVASATWLVLALLGKALTQRRTAQMNSEIQSNAALWKRLLSMDLKSIALLRFPMNH